MVCNDEGQVLMGMVEPVIFVDLDTPESTWTRRAPRRRLRPRNIGGTWSVHCPRQCGTCRDSASLQR